MDIVIDFDGTCVAHEFPEVGQDIGAVPVLKALIEAGHRLILFTMRSDKADIPAEIYLEHPELHPAPGQYLTEALQWFAVNEIPLYGVQTNPKQARWTSSPKAYGQMYIDDAALGVPLITDYFDKPCVDWPRVHQMLIEYGVLKLTGNILIDNDIMTS